MSSSNAKRKKKNFLFGGFSSGTQTDSQYGFTQRINPSTSVPSSRETTPAIANPRELPGHSSSQNTLDLRISPTPSPPIAEPEFKKVKREETPAIESGRAKYTKWQMRPSPTPLTDFSQPLGKTSVSDLNSTRRSTQAVPDSLTSSQSTNVVAETQMTNLLSTDFSQPLRKTSGTSTLRDPVTKKSRGRPRKGTEPTASRRSTRFIPDSLESNEVTPEREFSDDEENFQPPAKVSKFRDPVPKRGRGRKQSSASNSTRRSTQIVPDTLASNRSIEVTPERELVPTTSNDYQNDSNRFKQDDDDDFSPSPIKKTDISIGLFGADREIDHDARDYADETELDNYKRQDVIEFKDLRRKDKRSIPILDEASDSIEVSHPRVKKFIKAKQGCFYYGNENVSKQYGTNALVTYQSKAVALEDDIFD